MLHVNTPSIERTVIVGKGSNTQKGWKTKEFVGPEGFFWRTAASLTVQDKQGTREQLSLNKKQKQLWIIQVTTQVCSGNNTDCSGNNLNKLEYVIRPLKKHFLWIVGLLESMFIYCICTQYLIGAPFALITASIRRGMEMISLWHCWGGVEAQVSLTVAFSSSAFFGLLFLIKI